MLRVRWHLLYSCYSNTHPGMKKSEGEKKRGGDSNKKNGSILTLCCPMRLPDCVQASFLIPIAGALLHFLHARWNNNNNNNHKMFGGSSSKI